MKRPREGNQYYLSQHFKYIYIYASDEKICVRRTSGKKIAQETLLHRSILHLPKRTMVGYIRKITIACEEFQLNMAGIGSSEKHCKKNAERTTALF